MRRRCRSAVLRQSGNRQTLELDARIPPSSARGGTRAAVRRLEESLRWYENYGRVSEAEEGLLRIGRRTRKERGELPKPREMVFFEAQDAWLLCSVFVSTYSADHRTAHRVDLPDTRVLRFYGVGADPIGGARIFVGPLPCLVVGNVNWCRARRSTCGAHRRPVVELATVLMLDVVKLDCRRSKPDTF